MKQGTLAEPRGVVGNIAVKCDNVVDVTYDNVMERRGLANSRHREVLRVTLDEDATARDMAMLIIAVENNTGWAECQVGYTVGGETRVSFRREWW